jgi:asparagine synthase (glutamine-hydrolysing)
LSGIAGILRLDGSAASPETATAMAAAMTYHGPDGIDSWHKGPVALAHRHFWTTPEEVGEAQPVSSPDGNLCIVADARIDNRDELIPLLRQAGLLHRERPTDAELILAAYAHWGEECAARLIGDFAFAIWDAAARQLFAARDVVGIRQFFYAVAEGTFYVATTIAGVLAGLPARPPLNEPLLHAFVQGSLEPWTCQTVYEGLRRLPPAHSLVVRDGVVHPPRLYYVLGSQPAPSCRTDREWIDAFRAILDEAVRCRLRSQTPVGMAVSGGLDSSSMACVAHDLRQQDPSLPLVHLYSTVFDETPTADERAYFDMVAEQCETFPSTRVPSDHLWALREFGDDGGFPLDEPELFFLRSHTLAMFRPAAEDGCRVVFWGDGGDAATGLYVYHDPSIWLTLGWRDRARELRSYLQKPRLTFRNLLRSRLPEPLLATARQWRRRRASVPLREKAGMRQHGARCRLGQDYYLPPTLVATGQHVHEAIRRDHFVARRGLLDRIAAYAGVEQRLPYLDRRLLEFVFHLPPHLLSWRGEQRIILRESMRGTLPEQVRTRTMKNHFEGLNQRGMEQERPRIEALVQDSRAEALGYIEAGALRKMVDSYGGDGTYSVRAFRKALCLEAWLRVQGY